MENRGEKHMRNSTLKFGIVGAGRLFCGAHLKTLLEHPEVEIVAICDTNRSRAEKVAADNQVPHVYTDYKEMIANHPELDAIDVCTPNLYHSEISIAGLNADKHVFCEKPDAVSADEAQKMALAAEKSGKLLMVMRNNRFTAAAQFLRKYVDEGHMGDIYTGRCGWIRRRGIPGKGGWFTTKELSGGGPLIDLGVHFIDLAVWLMGNPKPIAVSGATYTKFAGSELSDSEHSEFGDKQAEGIFDVEDLAIGFIRFENGASLQIEFSWASNIGEEMNFIELRGSKSGFSMKKSELQIFTESAGKLVNLSPVLKPNKNESPHGENVKHFIECVFNRAKPVIKPEHGVDMIRIITALYESAETGREVRL
jgi:predicted dehydrogenase